MAREAQRRVTAESSEFRASEAIHWFEPIAEHLGSAYLRYSFTKGTVQEVDHLVAALGLRPGERVLDVGCGPGRHAHELARRGIVVHGVDISAPFVELARARCAARRDVRAARRPCTSRSTAEFDAAICLCQGAFGLMTAGGEDATVLAGIARALRPGGRVALSAFNAYFAVRHHDRGDVRRRHRRGPRAHRGARPRRRGHESTSGPAATRRASCACCSPRSASSRADLQRRARRATATTRRPPSPPSSSSSPAPDGERPDGRRSRPDAPWRSMLGALLPSCPRRGRSAAPRRPVNTARPSKAAVPCPTPPPPPPPPPSPAATHQRHGDLRRGGQLHPA